MSRESFIKTFRDAYMDLHAAYLAVLMLRHERNDSLPLVKQREMENKDPFHIAHPAGVEAVKRFQTLWAKHEDPNRMKQALAVVTEGLSNHYRSWSAIMEMCPPDIKKFKIDMPYDTYMLTATTISRGTLEKRAKVLQETWKRHVKGTL